MVLVDTSVWLRFLAGRAPYMAELGQLLASDQVCGHELVYGELLIGDIGGRQRVFDRYGRMRHAPLVPHPNIVEFVRSNKLHGRGIGWIDAHLLASALAGRMRLWTADPRFAIVADEWNIAYKS